MKLADKRKKYYTMIYTYKKRRKVIKDEYLKKSRVYNEKIRIWNRAIRRIDSLSERIGKIENIVFMFTGQRIIKKTGYKVPEEIKTAKCLYYKFGLENGIRAKELREHLQIEFTKRNEPTRYRRMFTKSFQNNPQNKEIWTQFKSFYEQLTNVA